MPSVTSPWTSCDFGASVVDDDDLHAGSTLYMCASVSFCCSASRVQERTWPATGVSRSSRQPLAKRFESWGTNALASLPSRQRSDALFLQVL